MHKWNQWAARIQEANLRDFYEILPCEKILSSLNNVLSSCNDDAIKKNIVLTLQSWVQQERETRQNAPWEATCMDDISLKDSAYVNKRPYIKQSECVGSSSNANKALPPSLELLHNISDNLVLGKFDEAQQLMQQYDASYQPQAVATKIRLFGAGVGGSRPVIFELSDIDNNLEKTLHAAYKNNVDLNHVDLSYQNLTNMDLRNLYMNNANFNGAQLDNTRFTEGSVDTVLPGMIIEPKFSLSKKDVRDNIHQIHAKYGVSRPYGISPTAP